MEFDSLSIGFCRKSATARVFTGVFAIVRLHLIGPSYGIGFRYYTILLRLSNVPFVLICNFIG